VGVRQLSEQLPDLLITADPLPDALLPRSRHVEGVLLAVLNVRKYERGVKLATCALAGCFAAAASVDAQRTVKKAWLKNELLNARSGAALLGRKMCTAWRMRGHVSAP